MMGVYSDVYKWQQMPQRKPDPKTVCNFCKQITSEDKLIVGPGVNICRECVDVCNEIVAEWQIKYRKKTIEEMARELCVADETLTADKAITLASSIFDAGYRKDSAQ
ncbi:hypothetical protein KZL06_004367 [Salmonella enterica subsp. enterica serovar Teshie]|nr:hypothetical protein [Salmonella enterica]EHY8811376.1 hypothetical protein [Salmonella enterica subsp. enterica serovar Teshie]EHU5819057.1 hypothetical protein [Salmonella enterica]EHU5827214.1 hypothetical protein [Salmonella enterica]EHU7465629.1 hypothetical protein [Salmonella enterica]